MRVRGQGKVLKKVASEWSVKNGAGSNAGKVWLEASVAPVLEESRTALTSAS